MWHATGYTTYLRGPSVVARVSAGLPFCWVSAAESASAVERGTFSALASALASDGSTLEGTDGLPDADGADAAYAQFRLREDWIHPVGKMTYFLRTYLRTYSSGCARIGSIPSVR